MPEYFKKMKDSESMPQDPLFKIDYKRDPARFKITDLGKCNT